jgi:hypothetical protein
MLILVESEHKVTQYWFQVWRQLGTSILFEGGKGTASRFLHPLVVVEDHAKELRQ